MLSIACSGGKTPELGGAAARLTPAQCAILDTDRSLVVHDAATIGAADFSLERTLQAIIDTSGGSPTTTSALLQSLINDFFVPNTPNPVSGLVMPIDVRPGEGGLVASDLLNPASVNFMAPVALFNRIDAAPADGSHCGEHRIVYAKQNTTGGRFFLIFEAVLPNPSPMLGIDGCKPVAEFWGSLSDPALFPTPASRAAALANFYYVGLSGFEPVVTHGHYGVPFGQVRSNHFMNFFNWQLREWRTSFDASAAATFQHTTVKQTPLAQFYDSAFVAGSGEFAPTNPMQFASERAAFQADFLANQIPELAAPELGGTATSVANIVNGFGSAFDNRFNEFQSHAQNNSDVPLTKAMTGFAMTVAGSAPAGLTATHILNRAGAMACGGCHQFSNGVEIGVLSGMPVNWPSSAFFVHVTEGGGLSPALTSFFLPKRMDILKSFVCPGGSDGGAPDGGSAGAGGAGGAGGGGGAGGSADAGCGGPYGPACPGTCSLKPRKFCCFEDSQCGPGFECGGAVCAASGEGRCEPVPSPGSCWDDSDCKRGQRCEGESICPCGVFCLLPDRPGECVSRCAADDAAGKGLCKMLHGFKWTGTACQAVVGCSCVGSDCDELSRTLADCESLHRLCLIKVPPLLLEANLEPVPPVLPPEPEVVAPEPTLPELVREVQVARAGVIGNAEKRQVDDEAAAKLDRAVEAARAAEQAEKGAFVARRRTH
jgi:hypothetical protein